METKIESTIISRLVCYIAVLYPFLNYYGYGAITFSFVIALLLFMWAIKKQGFITFTYPVMMICYVVYLSIMRIFCNVSSLGEIFAPNILYFFFLYGFLNTEVNFSFFLRVYKVIVFINILFFLFQECMYSVFGYRMIGIVTTLPSTIGGTDFDASQYGDFTMYAERSSAFFSEPAHFVQFLLPLLAIELLYVDDKNAYIRSLIYIVTLLALSSGNALLGMCVIASFFVVKMLKRLNPLFGIITVIFFIVGFSLAVNQMLKTEYGDKLMDRSEELDPNQAQVSSGFIRIFRGYYIWDEMSWDEKLIGLNSSTKLSEKIKHCSVASTFGENDQYMNAMQAFLIYTGYIGTSIFIFLLISLWRHNNLAGRCCIILYVVLGSIASMYFSYYMIFYLLIAGQMQQMNKPLSVKRIPLKLRFI